MGSFVFFDIDGTIFTPRLGVPDSTREAIDKLKKNGHHPVICTGRTRPMIMPVILELECEGILAGVGTYGEWHGEVLFDDVLPDHEVKELVSNFQKFGFSPYPEGTSCLYYDAAICEEPEKKVRRLFSLREDAVLLPISDSMPGVAKVSGGILEGSDIEGFLEMIRGRYHGINHYNILLETFPIYAGKGKGIHKLLKLLEKEDAETFAYGDSFNDLEMLEYVKHGVCMENGDPELLSRIPLHAGHIAEDGIYDSLKEFGLI